MEPEKFDSVIKIPMTFDKYVKGRIITKGKVLITIFSFIGWVILAILFLILAEGWNKVTWPFLILVGYILVVRFIAFRETYFLKKKDELEKTNYIFDSNVIWNIHSITDSYPYICYFGSGLKGIFVVFDKDVIVGKPEDNDYLHYEAIADAYQQMIKRGITCEHIDYMDVVGKDERMADLFKQAARIQNPDLREVTIGIYENIEYCMNNSYASYDVYCFYSRAREDIFWEDLQVVLAAFAEANYIRSRVLNSDEIGDLVKSVFNLEEFSVRKACENLYSGENASHYLKPIWVERGGKRFILNKTREEIAEAQRVAKSEHEMKRKDNLWVRYKKSKQGDTDEELDLFGNSNSSESISLSKDSTSVVNNDSSWGVTNNDTNASSSFNIIDTDEDDLNLF